MTTAPASDGPTGGGRPAMDLPSVVSDLRSTARWLTGGMAAVGAVLLSAGSLALPGRVDGFGDLLWALAGMAVGLCGVGLALWGTSEVLTPRVGVLQDLETRPLSPLRELVSRNPEDFLGPFGQNLEEFAREGGLRRRIVRELTRRAAREHGSDEESDEEKVLQRELAVARRNLELHRRVRRDLLAWVHAWQVHAALRRARWCVMGAAALVVAGAGLTLVSTASEGTQPAEPTVVWICPPFQEALPTVEESSADDQRGPCDHDSFG